MHSDRIEWVHCSWEVLAVAKVRDEYGLLCMCSAHYNFNLLRTKDQLTGSRLPYPLWTARYGFHESFLKFILNIDRA